MLAITSIAIFLTAKNYQVFFHFSEAYVLNGKIEIIKWVLSKILKLNPMTLQFSGIATGLYAVVTAIEATGLWYRKAWATVLVLVLVGISIPAEIFELIQGLTLLKLVVFLLNIAVFWYLLREETKRREGASAKSQAKIK